MLDCAKREVKEETGLEMEIARLIGVYSDPAGRIVAYPYNEDVVHLMDIVLGARMVAGELTCSSEIEEVRFFHRRETPADIVPPTRHPLSDALQGLDSVVR